MEISAAIVLVIVFAFLLIMGTPVSFSIITSAAVTITMFLSPQFATFIAAQKLTTGIDSFSLLAVPFFILAGNLMGSGGLAQRLVNLAMLVLGRVPGSLALTNIAGNAMFGSLSGSGIAAASAMGSVLRDPEENAGYEEEFSAATNIATAPVGQLIPPTNAFIIYSAACGGVSVATLFIAGWIPGLLWAALCMVAAFLFAKKHGYVVRNAQKLKLSQILKTIWDAVPSILMIVIIIGGILSGSFSPTEASGVAVVYAFILSVCIYGRRSAAALAGLLREKGYNACQLAMPKALCTVDDYRAVNQDEACRIGEAFAAAGVEISVLGCYMDLSAPDEEVRRRAVENVAHCLSLQNAMQARAVGSESSYSHLCEEEKAARYPLLVDSVLRITEAAAKHGAVFAIEPVFWYPLDTPARIRQLLETVGDTEHLRLIFDAANVLKKRDQPRQSDLWRSWLEEFGTHITAMHIKDFVLDGDAYCPRPLGGGVMDYSFLSRWVAENRPDMPLLREEVQPGCDGQDLAFLRRLAEGAL